MEQPYAERNLLVCLNDNSDPAVVDALMTDVEQSPWLNITDLNTLSNADPTLSGDDAATIVPQSDGINDVTRANLRQTLSTLQPQQATSNDLTRPSSPTTPSRPPQASKRGADSSSTRTASWPCTR